MIPSSYRKARCDTSLFVEASASELSAERALWASTITLQANIRSAKDYSLAHSRSAVWAYTCLAVPTITAGQCHPPSFICAGCMRCWPFMAWNIPGLSAVIYARGCHWNQKCRMLLRSHALCGLGEIGNFEQSNSIRG